MGRRCTYDDSHLQKAVNHPQDFPYKNHILKIFEKYGYYNEEIAFKVSKIRKWDDDLQQARYNFIRDIAILIPYLTSKDAEKVSNTPLGKDNAKIFTYFSAQYYLKHVFEKWQCENYRMLCSFLRDKKAFDGSGMPILLKDNSVAFYSAGVLRRISKAEYDAYIEDLKAGRTRKSPSFSEEEWIFLMDTFIVDQNGEDYSDYDDIEPDAFKTAVERAYNYIIEHVEDIRNDEELLSRAATFTTTRLVDAFIDKKIQSILGQRDVTYVQASRQISEAVDVSFFFLRLPGLLKEYQDWEFWHEGEHTTYMGKVKSTLIQWREDEYSHVSNYFVAQYLYFVLTGELVAKDGKVPMPIACVIDEVMRLFGYLEDIDWEAIFNGMQDQDGNEVSANRINAEIRKKRLDCVKHFFRVDPKTKEYFRLK